MRGVGGRGGGAESLGKAGSKGARAATAERELGKPEVRTVGERGERGGGGGRGAKLEDSKGMVLGVTAVRALDYSLGETELGMGWVAGHTKDFKYSLHTSKKHSYNPIGITGAARQGGRRINIYIHTKIRTYLFVQYIQVCIGKMCMYIYT